MRHRQSQLIFVLCCNVFLSTLLSGCAATSKRVNSPVQGKLAVVVIADQFPVEYLKRFERAWRGGVATLLKEGVVFRNASHVHAVTETCPGHASLITGTHPSKSGIVGNAWYSDETKKREECSYDVKLTNSPAKLMRTTLSDWVHASCKNCRTFSVSGKARAAIMLGGHNSNGTFWYSENRGYFATSPYYPSFPDWFRTYNSTDPVKRFFVSSWPLFRNISREEQKQYEIVYMSDGDYRDDFPHRLGYADTVPTTQFFLDVYSSPFVDELTLDIATRIVKEERLGMRGTTDLLSISLSAPDTVGHRYGPDSLEVFDTLMRLDEHLGRFLDFARKSVGRENVVIAFSSDHGIAPLPEVRARRGLDGHRLDYDDIHCQRRAEEETSLFFGGVRIFKDDLVFDREAIQTAGFDMENIIAKYIDELSSCDFVERIVRDDRLSHERGEDMPYILNRYPGRSQDLYVVPKKYTVYMSVRGTNHGTQHDYDRQVPMIFIVPGVSGAERTEVVATVDFAPTIAKSLGVPVPPDIDGKPLL